MQSAGLAPERRRDQRDDRRRSQAGPVVPPSPALVRHGSKQRKIPAALVPGGGNMPGQLTPHSGAAQVNVPVGSQQRGSTQHPYANAITPGGYDYGRDGGEEGYVTQQQQQYGRASPMVSTIGIAPPAVSQVRARGGEAGVAHGAEYNGQDHDTPPKPTFIRILTCRC